MIKNENGKVSLKKVLGGAAGGCFILGCCYQAVTGDTTVAGAALDRLSNFAIFILGIKVASGAVNGAISVATKKVSGGQTPGKE